MALIAVVYAVLIHVAASSIRGGWNRRLQVSEGPLRAAYTYPDVRRDDTVDELHGQRVEDPYRWLENPSSADTQQFVADQNDVFSAYIDGSSIGVEAKARMKQLNNYTSLNIPQKIFIRDAETDEILRTKLIWEMQRGLEDQARVYIFDLEEPNVAGVDFNNITDEELLTEESVFLDPNKWSEDGTIALTYTKGFSPDGQTFAYGKSENGSDWVFVEFMETESREPLPDTIKDVKFSNVVFSPDGRGVFYQMFPRPEGGDDSGELTDSKVMYHVMGTDQAADLVVVETPEHPTWVKGVIVTPDREYLICIISRGAERTNALWYAMIDEIPFMDGGDDGESKVRDYSKTEWVKLITNPGEHEYELLATNGTIFTLITDFKAPRKRIIQINIEKPDEDEWMELVPEGEDLAVLDEAMVVNETILLVSYMKDVHSIVKYYDLTTGEFLGNIEFDLGTVSMPHGWGAYRVNFYEPEIFLSMKDFLTPTTVYRLDFTQEEATKNLFRETKIEGYDSSIFAVSQVFYKSSNDTEIPMFILQSKEAASGAPSPKPCFLYAYGGFSVSIQPSFITSALIFVENFGGMYALANIRGGGEYGVEWHLAAVGEKRQTAFDDFHNAAEFLIESEYTTSDQLMVHGASNGGLLMAVVANQRPDLYKVVIPGVPVIDMFRYHLFTIGAAWIPEYGDPEISDHFDWLKEYHPLLQIKTPSEELERQQYPAILVLTAESDDRVVPMHAFKYVATLQHQLGSSDQQENPLMIRIETKAGHGAGKPISKTIEQWGDTFAFVAKAIGLKWTPPVRGNATDTEDINGGSEQEQVIVSNGDAYTNGGR